MRIAVCVKWVPAISRIRLDPETKRLVREGVPSELNAYDVLAVNRAVELKQGLGGSVAVYTMGPPEARRGLVRCLAMGADDAFHLNDIAFAGADTLATSRALALALAREEYDLVLFGNNSVDAETGQVGPEVAEMLGIPQITTVSRLDITNDGTVRAERALENGAEVVEGALPLLVSVTEGIAHDAQAPRDAVRAAEEREITELTAAMLADDVSQFGATGSPTWVAEVRQIEPSREGRLIQEGSVAEMAREAVAALVERGALDADADAADASDTAADAPRPGGGPELWVITEADESGLRPVTFEMLAAAQPVADALSGLVAAFVIGGEEAAGHAAALGHAGADVVTIASGAGLSAYSTAAYTAVLAEAIAERQPFTVLLPSTPNGRDLAARVSARLNLGLTGDCIGLDVDDSGLAQLKPAFGGNIVAPIYSRTLPNMATVRPGVFSALQPNPARSVPVETMETVPLPSDGLTRVAFHAAPDDDAAALDKARAAVCIGMGVGGPEHISALEELRALLGADLICTRDVVEAGWMPRQRQVGLTGRSIAPRLYLGIGVRGDFNHAVGIQRAGTVLAVNNDRRAAFFRGQSDIGVMADWQEFVPALVEELRRHRNSG